MVEQARQMQTHGQWGVLTVFVMATEHPCG